MKFLIFDNNNKKLFLFGKFYFFQSATLNFISRLFLESSTSKQNQQSSLAATNVLLTLNQQSSWSIKNVFVWCLISSHPKVKEMFLFYA